MTTKKSNIKAIDGGAGAEHAPRPHHGLIRALYDTVDACGGATLDQIRRYLPAAIDNISQVMRKNRLKKALYNAVYRGYLIHDDTKDEEYWHVAPIDYYNARQEHVKEIEARSVRGSGTPREEVVSVEALDPFYTIQFRVSKIMLRRVLFVIGAAALLAIGAGFGAWLAINSA